MFVLITLYSIFISEFSPASDPEWVELYNDAAETVSLEGWSLKDTSQKPKSLAGEVAPQSYFVFETSSGWLNNSGEEVLYLYDNSSPSAIIEQVSYGTTELPAPKTGKCITQLVGQGLASNVECTKGYANQAPPTSTPLPPTDTPRPPTHTPSPTSLPSPTPNPTSVIFTPTVVPKATTDISRPVASPIFTPGFTNLDSSPQASPSGTVLSDTTSFPFLPLSLGMGGLLCLGFSLFRLLKKPAF